MNIKLFYNVPWNIHHDRLEAKENLKAEVKGVEDGGMKLGRAKCGGVSEELCFRVLGETKLFKFFSNVLLRKKSFCSLV